MATDIDGILGGVKRVSDVQLAQRMAYTAGGLPEYIGEAKSGTATTAASWRIKKITYSGTNAVSIIWADGNTNFDNVWTNYATLSYS